MKSMESNSPSVVATRGLPGSALSTARRPWPALVLGMMQSARATLRRFAVRRRNSSRASTREKRGQIAWRSQFSLSGSAKVRAHVDELREERHLERLAQERHAVGAARAALVADHALDRLHVPEAPELKVLFHVDQLLAHIVRIPVLDRVVVDGFENRRHAGM